MPEANQSAEQRDIFYFIKYIQLTLAINNAMDEKQRRCQSRAHHQAGNRTDDGWLTIAGRHVPGIHGGQSVCTGNEYVGCYPGDLEFVTDQQAAWPHLPAGFLP